MDESKEKPEYFKESFKNINQTLLSYKINEDHCYKNYKEPSRANLEENTGIILFKMKCDSTIQKQCRQQTQNIMIMSNPYMLVFNKTVYFFEND